MAIKQQPLTIIAGCDIYFMILSFKCKKTEGIFQGRFSKKLPNNIKRIAERKLVMLHRSYDINDLRVPPANRLEALSGTRKGQHSIRKMINGEFVLNGVMMESMMLKSWIIIE